MTCPTCQTENPPGTKFCMECGSPLALRCPSCSAPYAAGQKFCGECGAVLAASPPEATEPAPVRSMPEPVAAAEMRLVSVLFVDLVGFTALSEGRDAEDVRELLGRYFDSSRTIVERYGGTIEKFIGDAVMAVWGVPVAREDDAERAVRAALDIVDAVSVFGSEIGAPDLRARAGVVTGQVAALENPGEGLVVGDRVNTASRVQSAAEPGSVYVDEVTRQVTSAAIAYADAGEHAVKGKADPLHLWHATRVVAGVGGQAREEGPEAPFVGRDPELRLVKDLFHAAQERRSVRLLGVSGEAGIGKSRLRREFFQYIDGLAGTVLWHSGRCLSYGEGIAYWALAEMVRQRLGIPEEAGAEEAREKLAAGLARWVPDAADREFLTPRLGVLLGVAEPGLGREELFGGWRMFFERLAAYEPVVMVFEDLQWADQGLLDFIGQLLDWAAASPIFILTLARPELAARHQGWPAGLRGATLLGLEPLDGGAMRRLLDGIVENLPPQAAERIVNQAEGVPLYAIETLRALADRGSLAQREGRFVLQEELGELDVPASLGSLLSARLDALEPDERQLLKAMSVFGGSFPRATAAALGEVPADRLDAVLGTLVRKQVLAIRADPLSPDRGQYAFAQGLLRTVAYEMLSRQERKARHLGAAEHLATAFPGGGEDVAEVIATHLVDALTAAQGDPDADVIRDRTVVALRKAAQRAATVGAPEVAERMYSSARELVEDEREQAELSQWAGEMALQAGRIEAALELLEAAAAAHVLAGRTRASALLAGPIGRALTRLGQVEEAITRTAAALDVLGGEGLDLDPEVGALNMALGRFASFTGDYPRAIGPLERALQIAEALQRPSLLAETLAAKAMIYGYTGRVHEATLLFRGSVELAEQHGLLDALARAHSNSGNLSLQWDLPAEPSFEAASALARTRGDRYALGVASGNLMTSHLLRGRWDEIERLIAELLAAGASGPFVFQSVVLVRAHRGQFDPIDEQLAQLDDWASSDDFEYRAIRTSILAVVALARGRAQEALELGTSIMKTTIETLSAASDPVRIGWPATLQAALTLGRLEDCRTLIGLLADLAPGLIPPYLRSELAHGRAMLAAAEGRHEAVEEELVAAIAGLRELGYPYALAIAQTDLAAWLLLQKRSADVEGPLKEAIAILDGLGAAPALERARSLAATQAQADPVGA